MVDGAFPLAEITFVIINVTVHKIEYFIGILHHDTSKFYLWIMEMNTILNVYVQHVMWNGTQNIHLLGKLNVKFPEHLNTHGQKCNNIIRLID